MAAAGIVSHGGFEFGSSDTRGVDELLAASDIRWIETQHFEIGFALGLVQASSRRRRRRSAAELTALAASACRRSPPRPRCSIRGCARTSTRARGGLWNRFLELMQVRGVRLPRRQEAPGTRRASTWARAPTSARRASTRSCSCPSEAAHVTFLQRAVRPADQEDPALERGRARHRSRSPCTSSRASCATTRRCTGTWRSTSTINLLDGYKHYSYETPIWIREGLAHFVEREIDPDYNSFDSSEGAVAEMTSKSNWRAEVRKLIQRREAPRMAELIGLKAYSELELEHHFTTWSMVRLPGRRPTPRASPACNAAACTASRTPRASPTAATSPTTTASSSRSAWAGLPRVRPGLARVGLGELQRAS